MTANKWAGIRAALCWNEEISLLSRTHNNANVICLPARFIDTQQAIKLVDIFFDTEFEGGRHEVRTSKINPMII
jgi:ribose 5-phosphate isomerase B